MEQQMNNITTTPYPIPVFISNSGIDQKRYKLWLDRKAFAHALRDSERWDKEIKAEDYRKAIHEAVLDSNGIDSYTKEPLDWSLIGAYDNEMSAKFRIQYWKKFMFLPSVDHVDASQPGSPFKICGMRTNDCKSHLTIEELMEFAKLILKHNSV
jgi:hypothetical protein